MKAQRALPFAIGLMLVGLFASAQYYPPSNGGKGTGTVTKVSTTSPLAGGPITATGTISCPTCGTGNPAGYTVVSFSATPTFAATKNTGDSFTLTLTGNVASSTLSGASSGEIIIWRLCQDSTGGRTFVAPTNVLGSSAPDPTASNCTNQAFRYDGTNAIAIAAAYVDNATAGKGLILPTSAAPSTPASATAAVYVDSSAKRITTKDDAGNVAIAAALGLTNTFTGRQDASGAASTAPAKTGTSVPDTCTVGDVYFKTDATAGRNLYFCPVTNTFAQMIGGTVFAGSQALGTSAIAGNACATAVTVSATGVASTDVISWLPNADLSGATGYGVASTDGLKVYVWPTANTINIHVCNGTGTSITPGAATLNLLVTR